MDLDLYFHYNRKRYKMQMVIYLVFWWGGYYYRTSGGAFARIEIGYWWAYLAYSATHGSNLSTGFDGTTTNIWVEGIPYRGNGNNIRCVSVGFLEGWGILLFLRSSTCTYYLGANLV